MTFRFQNFSVAKPFHFLDGFGFGIEKSLGLGIRKKCYKKSIGFGIEKVGSGKMSYEGSDMTLGRFSKAV